MRFHQSVDLEKITCVMISRETERFVNEIHSHNAEVRSSNELLDNLQASKEGMSRRKKGNRQLLA